MTSISPSSAQAGGRSPGTRVTDGWKSNLACAIGVRWSAQAHRPGPQTHLAYCPDDLLDAQGRRSGARGIPYERRGPALRRSAARARRRDGGLLLAVHRPRGRPGRHRAQRRQPRGRRALVDARPGRASARLPAHDGAPGGRGAPGRARGLRRQRLPRRGGPPPRRPRPAVPARRHRHAARPVAAPQPWAARASSRRCRASTSTGIRGCSAVRPPARRRSATRSGQLDGAQVYAEKNWGKGGFPDAWWWGQAQGFDDPGVCVAFAGGLVNVGPVRTTVTALVVLLPDGTLVRLGDPVVSPVRAEVTDEHWLVRGPQRPVEHRRRGALADRRRPRPPGPAAAGAPQRARGDRAPGRVHEGVGTPPRPARLVGASPTWRRSSTAASTGPGPRSPAVATAPRPPAHRRCSSHGGV